MSQAAEEKLKGMLKAAGLPAKSSYHPGEVCKVLGISDRTFWRLVGQYEKNEQGRPQRPDSLDSYTLSTHRRVLYTELVDFVARNNTYQRQHATHPDQMGLFE